MISVSAVALLSLLYFGLLFAVAYYADVRREQGRSIISNPYIYSLSLAVYLTSWTFYGSVGRAATSGLDFLPIYLGPTLIAFTWWFLLRKIVQISKEQNIVSIADFISSRYGKSQLLGSVVTIFAVLGIMPYIALQLKAVANTFDHLTVNPEKLTRGINELLPNLANPIDTAFIVALLLGLFGVLFGARHLDATERHEGLVAAVALESLVKIVAFVAVGIFVTYGLFDGFADIFSRFIERFPERSYLLSLDPEHTPYSKWFTLTFIAMMAFMFLPRQFHIMVIENSDLDHIKKAMWRFPAYMFLINLFVIPIALGGLLLTNGDTANADYFVIDLPLQTGHTWLALLVFIGGFSASAGMVMISSVALSTMILNHIIMPIILKFHLAESNISGLLINIKRLGIMAVTFLGYAYYRMIGESYALVNIGLISFIAATQFAPALIGGLYWRRATRRGAILGLLLGFLLWFYTLLVPSFVRSGWLDQSILEQGLFGITALRPLELFGLSGFDIWTHSLFWTMFFNIGAFLTLSLLGKPSRHEIEQADKFVSSPDSISAIITHERIEQAPTIIEFVDLMAKFIGEKQAHAAISNYLGDREIDRKGSLSEHELPGLKRFTEKTLAGSVGAAPAKIIIENYLETRGSTMEEVFDIFGTVTLSRTASREQLSVLYEAARIVASGKDLQNIMDSILLLLRQQFMFDLCVIRILNEENDTLVVMSQSGMTSQHLGIAERNLDMTTCIGESFLTNTEIVINDTAQMDKPVSAEVSRQEGIVSLAHAPITIEGQPIGVLSAFSKTSKGIFTDEFTEMFRNLAGQIGVAWRNSEQTEKLIAAKENERELQIAKTIQLGLLPSSFPEAEGFDIAGICVPARQVGGDYFDFLTHIEDKIDIVIADVSGHNIGAALIMAETRTLIRSSCEKSAPPAELMQHLNEFFYDDLTRTELFISMFYLSLDVVSGTIRYSNAGHNLPLVVRAADNSIEELDAEGMIIGVRKGVVFEEKSCSLTPNDTIVLYTDGITEAENSAGEFFGEDRLKESLLAARQMSAQQTIDYLLEQARLFAGNHNFIDDVSIVVIKNCL